MGPNKIIFKNDFDQWKKIIESLYPNGQWKSQKGDDKTVYECQNGCNVNWWKNRGTVNVQGDASKSKEIEDKIKKKLNICDTPSKK